MSTLYFSYHGGWTRSKNEAVQAARRGTKEDGGGVAESIRAYEVPRLTTDVLLDALNDGSVDWPHKVIAVVQNGKIVRQTEAP